LHGIDQHDLLLDLVGKIYEAAEAPQFWPRLLEQLADALRGATAILMYFDLAEGKGGISESIRFDPDGQRLYNTHYNAMDLWAEGGRDRLGTAFVATGQELCPEDGLVRSDFYNEFCRSQKLHHLITSTFPFDGGCVGVVSTFRPPGADAFSERETRFLQTLTPHFRRAFQLHRRLAVAESQQKAGCEALNALPQGVAIVNQLGEALWINQAAEAIFHQNDGLSLDSQGVRADRRAQTVELRKVIHDACDAAQGRGAGSGGAMHIERPSMQRPYYLLALPLPSTAAVALNGRPAAILFITDPEAEAESNESILSRIFGLTSAEARLAAWLMRGYSIQDCCDQLQVSRNTARSQLQRIFEKTNTSRQGELIRLLLRSPAGLRIGA
jgi:DNA-binding CsgD family transcriptional regulator